MNSQQEANLSQAVSSSKRQDKRYPHVINVENGRLMPNTPKLRGHKLYRVYAGPKDATTEQRLAWIKGLMARTPIRVVNSAEETFDIAKAGGEDIVAFALEHFGAALDATKPVGVLRRELAGLAGLPTQDVPVVSAVGSGLLSEAPLT